MKKRRFTPFVKTLIFISLTGLCSVQASDDFIFDRWQFSRAIKALEAKDITTFQQLTEALQDYPLYYYLRYRTLKAQLKDVSPDEIQGFLEEHRNTYFGESLRRYWLKQLAKKGDWITFREVYTPQKTTSLQCYYVQAHLMTGSKSRMAIRDAKKLWLVGYSQPKACDPVFDYLYQNNLIDDAMLWERIGLAMKKRRLSLAGALAKHLNLDDRIWVTRWQTMHKNPAQTLADFEAPDFSIAREIILHGIKRLARKEVDQANDYWNTFKERYAFSDQQIGEMQRDLALAAAKQDHPQAFNWLAALDENVLNDKAHETRLKFALKTQNWDAVINFIAALPDEERNRLQWRYWLARALEQNQKYFQSRRIYKELAQERDYYGFLAADRIGAAYQMQQNDILLTRSMEDQLMQDKNIRIAYEFYQLSQLPGERYKWLPKARQEWQYLIEDRSSDQQAAAAALASRWGWHDRAIMAAAKAGHYDDLNVRFPLVFRSELAAGANSQLLDLAWVYGIVRQESAFMTDVRSSAGALGLMQLMPATARLVAKKIDLPLANKRAILDIETNISLGTGYLRQVLDQFDGNHMLATASYNAGPHRAKRWLKENSCVPADIWVELIPFTETRKYVRRVLFYTSIFEHRLGQAQRPLRVALAPQENCLFDLKVPSFVPTTFDP
ncbi:MAG: transglycosylase SLT domain-containing protein [Candidatus Parabeggiatoa sp.]|nr:transglycosylase SLT domain-containing protein [Candidatus Parabeggiatoa sp.]